MVIRSPLSLLSSRLNKPYSLSLSSYGRLPSPLIIFVVLLWTLSSLSASFWCSKDQNWTQYSSCSLASAEESGIMTSSLLVMPLLMQPGILLACFAAAAHCSLMLSLLSTKTPRSLSTELLPSQVDPSLCCTPGMSSKSKHTWHGLMFNGLNVLKISFSYICAMVVHRWPSDVCNVPYCTLQTFKVQYHITSLVLESSIFI